MTRTILALLLLGAGVAAQDREGGTLQKIRTQTINVDFENEPLPGVINHLHELTGVNFVISPHVRNPESMHVTLRLRNVRVISVLRIVTGQFGLAAVYRAPDEIVLITTREQVRRKVSTEVYDVRDLLFRIRDFPGSRIGLERGDAISFVIEPSVARGGSGETLMEILRTSTGGDSWESERVRMALTDSDLLIVTQSRPVQQEIRRFLMILRAMR